jgi:hypothetical protein
MMQPGAAGPLLVSDCPALGRMQSMSPKALAGHSDQKELFP